MHFEEFDSRFAIGRSILCIPHSLRVDFLLRRFGPLLVKTKMRVQVFAFQDEGLCGGILPKLSLIPELSNNARSCSNRSLAHRKQSSDVIIIDGQMISGKGD